MTSCLEFGPEPSCRTQHRPLLVPTIMATSLPPDHPEATVQGIIASDVGKGAAVYSFDANATPTEKAAPAAKARSQVMPITSKPKQSGKGRYSSLQQHCGPSDLSELQRACR